VNPAGGDFCQCGEYLAWPDEPTGRTPATAPVATADPPTEAAPSEELPGRAALWLLVDGVDVSDPDASALLQVTAGGTLELAARVRNDSSVVDTFAVTVTGLPPEWSDVTPPHVDLLPAGPQGDTERDVAIAIHPPRTSAATAGPWTFSVAVRSSSRDTEDARVPVTVTVAPFYALDAAVRPQIASGRRRTAFVCDVSNAGNAVTVAQAEAKDAEQACVFSEPPARSIAPGTVASLELRVRPTKPLWVGRPHDHRVHVTVQAAELAAPVSAGQAVFRQRPWVAWWVPALATMLVTAAVALYLLLPRTVTMPALIGDQSSLAAVEELAKAGFQTHPTIKVLPRQAVSAGTVLRQAPSAGSHVKPTAAVTIFVAGARPTTIVPRLVGLRTGKGEAILVRVRLKLGSVAPGMDPKATIKSQVPAAGSNRPQGTPVDVVLAPRMVRIPDLHGHTPPGAEKILHAYGLVLGNVQPKVHSKARIASQLPEAGQRRPRGTVVDVVLARRQVNVPKLRGLSVQHADKVLTACSLKLGPLPPGLAPNEHITGQVPAAHTRRPPGTVVTLILVAPKAKTPPKVSKTDTPLRMAQAIKSCRAR
jgi:beta-lactam-binding protein with PASTA domain